VEYTLACSLEVPILANLDHTVSTPIRNHLLTSEGRASTWGSFSSCGPDFIGSSRPQGRLVSRIVQPELVINGANF
jgi:hypothetical protein